MTASEAKIKLKPEDTKKGQLKNEGDEIRARCVDENTGGKAFSTLLVVQAMGVGVGQMEKSK